MKTFHHYLHERNSLSCPIQNNRWLSASRFSKVFYDENKSVRAVASRWSAPTKMNYFIFLLPTRSHHRLWVSGCLHVLLLVHRERLMSDANEFWPTIDKQKATSKCKIKTSPLFSWARILLLVLFCSFSNGPQTHDAACIKHSCFNILCRLRTDMEEWCWQIFMAEAAHMSINVVKCAFRCLNQANHCVCVLCICVYVTAAGKELNEILMIHVETLRRIKFNCTSSERRHCRCAKTNFSIRKK